MPYAGTKEMSGRNRDPRRGAWVVEVAILIVLPVLAHCTIPVMIVIAPPYSSLGAAVMVLGLGVMMWTAKMFRQAKTGFQLREGGTALVTSGPFRFSRNPMYLGMLLWLTGLAILLGSLIAFVFPMFLFLLAHFLLIPREEERMEETFGEEYATYGKCVRRWV
jgi:protein-S-isoprenylcysteine O-methyltransferase Ste14